LFESWYSSLVFTLDIGFLYFFSLSQVFLVITLEMATMTRAPITMTAITPPERTAAASSVVKLAKIDDVGQVVFQLAHEIELWCSVG